MSNKSITAQFLWDRFGIGVSTICAIHCLFFPVLISTLPLWSFAITLHDWVHPVFIVLLAPIVYFASRRSHYDVWITAFLVAGFIIVIVGWVVGHLWLGVLFETSMTLLGSGLLIAGHWFNYRHHRSCSNSAHKHHPVEEEETSSLKTELAEKEQITG